MIRRDRGDARQRITVIYAGRSLDLGIGLFKQVRGAWLHRFSTHLVFAKSLINPKNGRRVARACASEIVHHGTCPIRISYDPCIRGFGAERGARTPVNDHCC